MYAGTYDGAAHPEATVWVQWCGSNRVADEDREALAEFRDQLGRPGRVRVKA